MFMPVHPRRLAAVTVALAAGLLALPVEGQGPSEKARQGAGTIPIVFRVLTADGDPVLDLSEAEVSVKIDGRARTIRSLDLVRFAQAPLEPDARPAPALPPPFVSNVTTTPVRDVLLVIEDDSIAVGNEETVRSGAGHLLASLAPSDRVGLLNISTGILTVPLTADHDRVRAALASFVGRAPRGVSAEEAGCRTRRTLQSLQDLFRQGSLRPGATVVFFSSGLTPPDTTMTPRWTPAEACQVRKEYLADLGREASRSPVHFYAVHVLDSMRVVSGGVANELQAGVEHVAGVTGGVMLRLTGTDQAVLGRINRETMAHYVSVVDVEASDRNGAVHRVEVQTGREGANVRVQPQMLIAKAGGPSATAGPRAPGDLLRVSRSFDELPIRAAAYASPDPEGGRPRVVAVFESSEPSVRLRAASVGLFDGNGKLTSQGTPEGGALQRAPVVAALAARPGSYRLRVAATDESGRRGTVDLEVHLADPAKGALKASALILGVIRQGRFVPTLEFGGEDAAVGHVEIYGVRQGAQAAAQIELAASPDGPTLAAMPARVQAMEIAGAHDVSFTLPLGGVPPGDVYVRAVISVDGAEVARVGRTLRKAPR